MLHERFRTHRLNVDRMIRSSDGAGGWPANLEPAGTVDGSLQPAQVSDVEREAADQERAETRWNLYTDPGVDVHRDDELVVAAVRPYGSDLFVPVFDGERYRVISVGDWHAASSIDHIAIALERIQHGE